MIEQHPHLFPYPFPLLKEKPRSEEQGLLIRCRLVLEPFDGFGLRSLRALDYLKFDRLSLLE